MTKPKRQHWVPRLYLSSFATPETADLEDPYIWCFHKEAGEPFCTSIKNVAAETYLYSPLGQDGARSWEMEDKLAGLESAISPLWRALADDFVDLGHETSRKGIALFVATLFLRNPQRLEDHRHLQNEVLVRLKDLEPTKPPLPTLQEQPQPATNAGTNADTDLVLRHGFVDHIRASGRRLAEQLMAKRWAVIYSEEPSFATSDNPLMVTHEDQTLRGLDSLRGTLILPVSPTRVLMLDDSAEPPNAYYKANPYTPGACNGLSMRHSLRFLLSSVQSDQILAGIVAAGDRHEPPTAGV
jgi:Protein of unknown function (DUF4238)